jgi:hypothetical protein
MKSLTNSKRHVRSVLTDFIIYGNLAFTFVFFSAAFNRGCSDSSGAVSGNEIAVTRSASVPSSALVQKGQTKSITMPVEKK